MIRTMKNVAVFITALVLVAGMVSCENWMIEKLLERNEPSGDGGGNGGGGGGSGDGGSNVAVTEVQVYPESLSLGLGKSFTLIAQVIPGNATDQGIEWSSSDDSVVSVDTNGMVTMLKRGNATITATSASNRNESGHCEVEVAVNLPLVDEYRTMYSGTIGDDYLWAATSTQTGYRPIDTAGRDIDVASFAIGRTEVRYELWYIVKEWGARHGYEFENKGQAGRSGTAGDDVTDATRDLPVTNVSWRDIIVWCNAYSEMTGKEPVYRNKNDNSVLRDSRHKGSTVSQSTVNDVEKLVIDDETKIALYNGYRLPTETEWEYAARGGVPSKDAGSAWTYKWPGTDTLGDVGNFAWYGHNGGGGPFRVAQKTANSAGLYDMAGNVAEWCFTVWDNTKREIRGGSYSGSYIGGETQCSLVQRGSNTPDIKSNGLGFRVVCR